MIDTRDAELQRWFTASPSDLDDAEFTERVMHGTRRAQLRVLGGAIAAVTLLIALAALAGAPLGVWTVGASRFFTTAIVDLGEGWWTLLLAPLNTIGGLLVLGAKALRMLVRRSR